RDRHRRPRGRESVITARGTFLEGTLPVPRREDAVLHGQSRAAGLALLRLREGRRRLRVAHGTREGHVSGGAPEPRGSCGRRAATDGTRAWRRGAGPALSGQRARERLLQGVAPFGGGRDGAGVSGRARLRG